MIGVGNNRPPPFAPQLRRIAPPQYDTSRKVLSSEYSRKFIAKTHHSSVSRPYLESQKKGI
jgi:hypothetical protein